MKNLILLIFLASCHVNYTESGKKINMEKDAQELAIAKKSLLYIEQGKTDSLNNLLNADVLNNSNAEQLDSLYLYWQSIVEHKEYPSDSIITVSTTTKKSGSGEETFKEFLFPFTNKSYPDSTVYFEILVADGEIYKLMLKRRTR